VVTAQGKQQRTQHESPHFCRGRQVACREEYSLVKGACGLLQQRGDACTQDLWVLLAVEWFLLDATAKVSSDQTRDKLESTPDNFTLRFSAEAETARERGSDPWFESDVV
jgi:hypothetical protein